MESANQLVREAQVQGVFADIGGAVGVVADFIVGLVGKHGVTIRVGLVGAGIFVVACHLIVQHKAVVGFGVGGGGEDHKHTVRIDGDRSRKGFACVIAVDTAAVAEVLVVIAGG